MLIQADEPNKWYAAQEWQKLFVKQIIKEMKVFWAEVSHTTGVQFSETVRTQGGYEYKIGWIEQPMVLVNVETHKARDLWFPSIPPPDHGGAQTILSQVHYSY